MSDPEKNSRQRPNRLKDLLQSAVEALEAQGDAAKSKELQHTAANLQAWSDLIGQPEAPPVIESAYEQMGLDMAICAGEIQAASSLMAITVLAAADNTAFWASVASAQYAGLPIPAYNAPMVERLREMTRAAGLIPERTEEAPHAR